MATFTQDDIDYLKNHGNGECAKTWLGLWDPKRAVHQDQRELMIDKYERKRYYLEPASPLKSLTNAVSLKSGSTAAGAEVPTTSGARAAAIAGTTSTTAASGSNAFKSIVDGHTDLVHVVNGFGHNTKSQYRQQSGNAERSFEVTPPSTQRTTMNGLHKAVTGAMGSTSNSGKATSAISRPQHQQNGYSDLQEAFMQKCNKNMNNNAVNNNNNELNVLHMTTSRMSDSGSATSMNGFGADADFVADFGSASIFDATMVNHNQMSSPPKLNRSGGAISSNGYAKIQPLKRQQYHSLNAHDQTNGTSSQSESIGNATSENFADFEHAPIFNAAANYQFVRKTVIKRCAGGQQSDRADPKAPTVREESLTQNQFRTLAYNCDTGMECALDKNLYADIRQATTHADMLKSDILNANNFSFSIASERQSTSPKLPEAADASQPSLHSPIQTPFLDANKSVNEYRSQIKCPQICAFSRNTMQAEYSGCCAQVCCAELKILNNKTQCQDHNQDECSFSAGNIPKTDWSQFANSTPCWPSGSTIRAATVAREDMPADPNDEAASIPQDVSLPYRECQQQQVPPTFCPQIKFCGPTTCPFTYHSAPFSPGAYPPSPCCPSASAPNENEEQQANVTIASLSYGAIPPQTVINTVQSRLQNGGKVQTEACLEPTPSYSTLYNRSYRQPPVYANQNPFIQQAPAQSASISVFPECYNPFHPYCISGSCPKGCTLSNTMPVGDPIIESSCNIHSPYNNCFCNNCCLPIPNNNSRSMNTQQSNSQNNNNNALSSTPSEDRYAALKDLDEQLRESKAAATVVTAYGADTFGHTGICNSVNPFKHQQVNPFQAATHGTSPTATQSYFGQMTVISNGNGISSQQPTTATQFYNYSNGYVNATTTAGTATVMATGPSGCGFSLGALQPTAIAATGAGGGGAFSNPFAATGAMNSNNPFL
ncbi:uncharacterized protein LOC129249210 isoform X2 [Anastrepha obliqua]|uniref:uncharacterized protein LOC129249210 isoform X2 n=1 Tax=Anastrepha obliqua TaxID=95512 RepID=UPI00240A585F|nr:uncharacterized protein LOC129249210 isoform X2 [Anastrepha obliqua]